MALGKEQVVKIVIRLYNHLIAMQHILVKNLD